MTQSHITRSDNQNSMIGDLSQKQKKTDGIIVEEMRESDSLVGSSAAKHPN